MRSNNKRKKNNGHQDIGFYWAQLSKHRVLDREQEKKLMDRYRSNGDQPARQMLINSNLRFVVKVAHEYRGYECDLMDLIQEGNVGLIKAIDHFDPAKGVRLITYAVYWIRAQITDFVLRTWSLVKIGGGRVHRRLFFKLRSEWSQAVQKTGSREQEDTVARQLNVASEQVGEMKQRLDSRDTSLDAPRSKNSSTPRRDLVASNDPSPHDLAVSSEENEVVRKTVFEMQTTCNSRQKFILNRRLLTDEPLTLGDIGHEYGLSCERIRQIETAILDDLKGMIEVRGLIPDYAAIGARRHRRRAVPAWSVGQSHTTLASRGPATSLAVFSGLSSTSIRAAGAQPQAVAALA
jgi:RNA polymerase sigma-32 factor